jgi:predicted nucleic acid-binding protein
VTLVDSNVLLDLFFPDEEWHAWSRDAVSNLVGHDVLAVNDVIFAEVSHNFDNAQEVAAALQDIGLVRAVLTDNALFAAATAFKLYRSRGGTKTHVLPDFFIGAQAEVDGMRILTRDVTRYRTYFPGIELIAPDAS